MKVGFINVANNKNEEFLTMIDIQDNLTEYHRLLNCDTIDIAMATVGGRDFNFVVDDEGFLKSDIVLGATSVKKSIGYAGNIIITNHCDDDLTDLTEEDFQHLKKYLGIIYPDNQDPHFILILNDTQ